MRSYSEFIEAACELADHPAMKPMPTPVAAATFFGGAALFFGLSCFIDSYDHAAIALWIAAAPLLTPFALRVVARIRIRRTIRALRNEARSQRSHADA